MQKVLVTGGAGFVGNHLVNHLLLQGMEVVVLDKAIYKAGYYNNEKAAFIEGDILSANLVYQCLKDVDTCFHLAALASVPACENDWMYSHANNVLGFNTVLNAIKELPHTIKLIYASSSAVYGNNINKPQSESMHVIPSSTYGADKLSNEIYAAVIDNYNNTPSIGLRFFNIYGPGQQATNAYSGVMSQFKKAILTHQPLTIYGDGKQSRDFIYIDDAIDALMLAATTHRKQPGIFNICTGQSVSILKLAELMMQLSQTRVPISFAEKRKSDINYSCGDITRAKKELGFVAKTSINHGIKQFLNCRSS